MFIKIIYIDQVVIGRRDLFLSCHLYFFPYSRLSSYLLRLPLCLISFLLFHARVFEKTLVHEFHISYSNTEWSLFFSLFGARETKHAQRTLLQALFLKWRFKQFNYKFKKITSSIQFYYYYMAKYWNINRCHKF